MLQTHELWFKYEKNGADVVRGLSLSLGKGEFLALVGGNGAGKTTALSLLAGLQQPYRGEISLHGSIAVLPQNPQTLFVKKTLGEDLREIFRGSHVPGPRQQELMAWAVSICRLDGLLERHPYDLSGGEQQRAALAKVLLRQPDILLMDEPTKGLDAEFKQSFAMILRSLLSQGVSILMVSHDIEFCAENAHRCALFFDGGIVAQGKPREFFSGNSFYTTSANRMARAKLPQAVTTDDIIAACGGKVSDSHSLPEVYEISPEAPSGNEASGPEKLPLWRRITAAVSGITALVIFAYFIGVSDLTRLVSSAGITQLSKSQLWMYALFVIMMIVFALSVGRKSRRSDALLQTPVQKRKLSKRSLLATALIVLLIPLTLFVGETYLGGRKYYFISLLIMLEIMLPFFLVFEGRKPKARELVVIAVLCALAVAGRTALFMLPEFKPVWAITIIAGVAFGGETGFLVGAVSMLVSNMMFSQGPWTPWQMFAMGIIGFLAGILFRKGVLRRDRLSLCCFGSISCVLVYGLIMNCSGLLMSMEEFKFKALIPYLVTGFPVDCVHAAATWVFLWFAAEPFLEKLDRIKVKYGLVE